MVIATGMTLVLIAGGIELSVGSLLALAGVVLGIAIADWAGRWYPRWCCAWPWALPADWQTDWSRLSGRSLVYSSSLAFLSLLSLPMPRNVLTAFLRKASNAGVSKSRAAWPTIVIS
jgi:ribose/xylose/arabinose/galactoside ABC-type transport system permease subunit